MFDAGAKVRGGWRRMHSPRALTRPYEYALACMLPARAMQAEKAFVHLNQELQRTLQRTDGVLATYLESLPTALEAIGSMYEHPRPSCRPDRPRVGRCSDVRNRSPRQDPGGLARSDASLAALRHACRNPRWNGTRAGRIGGSRASLAEGVVRPSAVEPRVDGRRLLDIAIGGFHDVLVQTAVMVLRAVRPKLLQATSGAAVAALLCQVCGLANDPAPGHRNVR